MAENDTPAEPVLADAQTKNGNVPYWIIEPSADQVKQPHGVILCFERKGSPAKEAMHERWKHACSRHRLILVGISPQKNDLWQGVDINRANLVLEEIRQKYAVDPDRIILYGSGTSVGIAEQFLQVQRGKIRGIVTLGAANGPRDATDPSRKLACLFFWRDQDPKQTQMARTVRRLKDVGYPVIGIELPGVGSGSLDVEQAQQVARWSELLALL